MTKRKKNRDGARTRQERDRKQGQEDRNRDMDRTEAKREGLIDRKWADAVACLERETDTVRHLFLAFGCDICGFLLQYIVDFMCCDFEETFKFIT